MNQAPLVSIVIPVYNGGNYLRQAIDSALAQTYRNIEVLVVNDGSSDGNRTQAIARSYGDKIRYLEKPNGGVATALNLGIEQMRGEYFSWLSHDDLYRPDKVERQIRALAAKPAGTIAYCDFSKIDSKGRVRMPHYAVSSKGEHSMRAMLAFGTETVHGCGLLVPAELFKRLGCFDPTKLYTQDYDLWFRFAAEVPFVHIAEPLVLSREHDEQNGKRNAVARALEADRLHGRMLLEVSEKEIESYCGNSLDYLAHAQSNFASAGHTRTAARILRHMARIAVAGDAKASSIVSNIVNKKLLFHPNPAPDIDSWRLQLMPLLTARKDRPRLLVYSHFWIRGGIERVLSIHFNRLKDRYSIVLVSGTCKGEESYPLDESITHIKLGGMDVTRIADRIAGLAVLLDVDLVVGNPNLVLEFLDVYGLLRDLAIKSIAYNHAYFYMPHSIPNLFPVIKQRIPAFQNADAVTWLTSFGTHIYGQLGPNGVCMPNPCMFEEIPVGSPVTKKIVLCVGRFNDGVKRLDCIFAVFAKVLVSHPDAELVLVGRYELDIPVPHTPRQTYRNVLERLAIPPASIRFEGEQARVAEYYSSASIFLLTSECEGFPMAMLEAGRFGLPCAIFEIPGLEDIITDGENGFIAPQGDIAGLAAKVSLFLGDTVLQTRMGLRARELVRRFAQDQVCKRFESLIETVLASRDSKSLNEDLRVRFGAPIADPTAFVRRAVVEYEKGIAVILDATRSKRIWNYWKKFAVIRSVNSRLFKPYVKPMLRKARNFFFPAALKKWFRR